MVSRQCTSLIKIRCVVSWRTTPNLACLLLSLRESPNLRHVFVDTSGIVVLLGCSRQSNPVHVSFKNGLASRSHFIPMETIFHNYSKKITQYFIALLHLSEQQDKFYRNILLILKNINLT